MARATTIRHHRAGYGANSGRAAHNLDADEAFALAADVDRLLDLRNRVQRGELTAKVPARA